MWAKTWISVILLFGAGLPILGQQLPSMSANAAVPSLVSFNGTLSGVNGKPLTGVAGVTFSLYKEQEGGVPLWIETQNVEPDKSGHYSVMLGSTSSSGLPSDIFVAGEARWLGVQVQGQSEQPRVMLLSVPYALKAGDAQTVGGLPPSAFVLAAPPAPSSISTSTNSGTPSSSIEAISGTGTTDFIPLWTNSTTLGNSVLFQSGTGSTAKIGINTTTPTSTLDVRGAETVRGLLSLPATGTATSSASFNSQPVTQAASSFNSSTGKAVTQTFQWQAEPSGNNTSSASGTLNLLFGSGTSKPSETGLHIGSNGQITFAGGQTFPGTGSGTITGVTAGTDLTGGGSSGNVTLNLDTTKVPQLNAANTFTGNQTVNGNLTSTGVVTGSSYQIGSNLFAFGSFTNGNAFLGFAGNSTMTGTFNTGTGFGALALNTTGFFNTAVGINSLDNTTTGFNETAVGRDAGFSADASPMTGSGNTFLGSLTGASTGTLTNATAIGANAEVGASNALVLGSIAGVNLASASTNVGIGTTIPQAPLDVVASGDAVHIFVGNVGCGNSNAGIVIGTTFNANCQSYAISGDTGGNTYLDAPGGSLHLRISPNTDAMVIDPFGNVNIVGNLTKGSGSFKIDHPLDPANKYLYHSFVESPDMMNVYNGNVTTNARGLAVVILPDYFEALNRDFRYQLTVIGQFSQAIVAREIDRNRFTIRTTRPHVKVSWQVTGIRHDAYANAQRIQVEEEKAPQERGKYLHPELFGASPEEAIGYSGPVPHTEASLLMRNHR
jgi:hypothetical protein